MKKKHIELSQAEIKAILKIQASANPSSKIWKRCTALLELNKNKTYQEVGEIIDMGYSRISALAKKYESQGLKALYDQQRSGRPNDFSPTDKMRIVRLSRSQAPYSSGGWTLRLLAEMAVKHGLVSSISHTMVGLILDEFGARLNESKSQSMSY